MPGQATGKAMQQRTQATGQMAPRALGTAATNKTAATKKAPAPARLKPGAATKTAATSGTTRKTAGAKSPAKRKQSRNASREAGDERVRPIARVQTLTETIANIAGWAQQPMDTVRRVLQASAAVAEAHLCRGGSGKINLPYVGVQLYRARQAARSARMLPLFGTERTIELRRFPARLVARSRVLTAMRNATLRCAKSLLHLLELLEHAAPERCDLHVQQHNLLA